MTEQTSWWRKLGGLARGADAGGEEPPTPADSWTVPGIYFDTTGWQLTASSPSSMTWQATHATLRLTRSDVPNPPAFPSLHELRTQHRDKARAAGEDIVQVELSELRPGHAVLAIYKRKDGSGYAYRGLLEIRCSEDRWVLESDMNEGGRTGTREAMVHAMRVQSGEFGIGKKNADGSHAIEGWLVDAYDPAFDEGALNALSDDERIDCLMPGHPLTRTRALLRRILSSFPVDAGAVDQGPRRALSARIVRGIYDAAGLHDLVEQSFKEEIDSFAEAASPKLALCLLEMGMSLRLKDRGLEAISFLARAEEMFVAIAGEDAMQTTCARVERAYALFTLGRHVQALPLFVRVIKVLEQNPFDDRTYVMALHGASNILTERGDHEQAREYRERLRPLVEKMTGQKT